MLINVDRKNGNFKRGSVSPVPTFSSPYKDKAESTSLADSSRDNTAESNQKPTLQRDNALSSCMALIASHAFAMKQLPAGCVVSSVQRMTKLL